MSRENEALTPIGIPGPKPISNDDFGRFAVFIRKEAGIHLTDVKKALLVGRLSRRLRDLGIDSFAEYFELATRPGSAERQQLIDSIATNETHFFREPQHFRFLVDVVFPRLHARRRHDPSRRRVRVWSAACSTGEEPYSIAMLLLDHFPPDQGWELDILATDVSQKALQRARDGVWPMAKAAEISDDLLKKFMLRGFDSQEGFMRASDQLRCIMRFDSFNLMEPNYSRLGDFDLLFCRNVLIYFDAPTKRRVVENLLARVTVDGYLFLGHAESLVSSGDLARCVAPTVYSRISLAKEAGNV